MSIARGRGDVAYSSTAYESHLATAVCRRFEEGRVSQDIFEFWSQIARGEHIHPADKRVFSRMRPEKHGFRLDCLPGCFGGRLRDAPVVLLYLSPGFGEQD